jgi:two-component system, chemotaxis family, protein-glutamate methylesterase/glutaminase
VEALKELVSGLPPDFPVAVFVVLHIPAQTPSVLPSILSRFGALEAIHPEDGDAIQPGRIYVVPLCANMSETLRRCKISVGRGGNHQ